MKTITLKNLSTLLVLMLIGGITQAQNCPYEVKIALVADFSMFEKHGANTEQYMRAALTEAATKFDNEFNEPISFRVVEVYVANTPDRDIWSSTSNSALLMDSFIEKESDRNAEDYDIGSFWTNRDIFRVENGIINNNNVGLARDFPNQCIIGYNIIEDTEKAISTFTHELGHIFGAEHDAAGENTIMAPSSSFTVWSSQSLNEINEKLECVCPFIDLTAGYCSNVTSSEIYSISFNVRNIGNLSSTQTTAKLYLSDDNNIAVNDFLVDSKSINAINPSEETRVVFSGNLNNINLPGGSYSFGVIIDSEDNILERNENNNTTCIFVVVLPEGEPDLTITNCGSIIRSGNTIRSGGIVVENLGNEEASASAMGIYLSVDEDINREIDYSISSVAIGTLGANTSKSLNFSINISEVSSPMPAGSYHVGFLADSNNSVSESSETNNTCYDISPKFTVTYGCKDANALNYMPEATPMEPIGSLSGI